MGRAKYNWRAADVGIRCAIAELFAAQRHCNHSKPVNVLNDLIAAEAAIVNVRKALLGSPQSVPAVGQAVESRKG